MGPLTSKKAENKTNKILQSSIKTKPMRIGLSNKDRNVIRLQNEYKKWEQLLFSLQQAIKYISLKEGEATKEKIVLCRSHAQSIAESLYPYYQEYKSSIHRYDDHLTYYNSTNNSEDGMSKMLRDLHVDPETIHYSSVSGDYY